MFGNELYYFDCLYELDEGSGLRLMIVLLGTE